MAVKGEATNVSRRAFFGELRATLGEPGFWAYASWLEIVTRYRRTSLGAAWILVPPLVFITLLGWAYAFLMGYSPQQYLPHLAVGYLLWRFIIQVMSDGAGILRGHKSFIMDGRSRLTDFTMRVLTRAFLYLAVALLILLGIFLWSPAVEAWRLVTLLFTLPLFMVNMLWLAAVFMILGARFPDLSDFMNTIVIFGFLLTPILWFPDQAPGGTTFGALIRINPAFHLIEMVRAPLIGYTLATFSALYVAVLTLSGAVIASVLYRRYARYVPFWL